MSMGWKFVREPMMLKESDRDRVDQVWGVRKARERGETFVVSIPSPVESDYRDRGMVLRVTSLADGEVILCGTDAEGVNLAGEWGKTYLCRFLSNAFDGVVYHPAVTAWVVPGFPQFFVLTCAGERVPEVLRWAKARGNIVDAIESGGWYAVGYDRSVTGTVFGCWSGAVINWRMIGRTRKGIYILSRMFSELCHEDYMRIVEWFDPEIFDRVIAPGGTDQLANAVMASEFVSMWAKKKNES